MVDVSELKKLEIFSVFSGKQLDQLAKMTDKKKFKANSHIYEHGGYGHGRSHQGHDEAAPA